MRTILDATRMPGSDLTSIVRDVRTLSVVSLDLAAREGLVPYVVEDDDQLARRRFVGLPWTLHAAIANGVLGLLVATVDATLMNLGEAGLSPELKSNCALVVRVIVFMLVLAEMQRQMPGRD